jgi:hypothetical protein
VKYISAFILLLVPAGAAVFWAAHPVPGDFIYYFINFAAAAALITIYLALGIKALKALKINAGGMKYPFAFALSLCVVGTLFFIAGVFGLYNVYFAFAVPAVLTLLCYREIKEVISDAKVFIEGAAGVKVPAAHAVFYAAGGFAAIYFFFACLTPPVYYDTLSYHLAVPQQYIQAGRIINIRENIFSFYPQLMQMNCLFFLLISYELSVKLLYFFMGVMSLAALAGLADELKSDKKITLLLLLTCPLFFLNSTRIGSELPLMFFALLLVYMAVKCAGSSMKAGEGAIWGIIAGSIISVKYTGAVIYIFGAAILIYLVLAKKAGIMSLILYILVPAAIVSPYLIKNYFYSGDPVYPFFSGFFEMEAGLKADASGYVRHVAGFGLPHTLIDLLASPAYVISGRDLFGGDIISPLFLLALAMLPLTDIKKTGIPALFICFYYVAWFYTGEVLRFLLPLVPAAAAIAGRAYASVKPKFKYLAFGALIAAQAGASLYFGEKFLTPFQLLTAGRGEYIKKNVSYYPAAEFINKNTEKGAVVLVLGEARTYYLERQALAYTVFNKRAVFEGFDEMDEDKVIDGLKWRNIRYILVNWAELDRLKSAGYEDVAALAASPKFKNIMDKYFKKIYSDGACEVYEMKGRNS